MSNNNQQPNTADDFSEFDFDENDVLVKDGEKEINETQEQENKKTKKQKNKNVDNVYANQSAIPTNASILRQQLGAPLELKKLNIRSESNVGQVREDLIKQASMQKDKMEALKREGEGLVYGEKDEEEIEKFKNKPLARSSFNVDLLVRTLMGQLSIVSTLKIDLINRLRNIISSFLRDVRTSRATEELLQRSIENGGLNLSSEHSEQIMDFIKDEYKRIHLNVPVAILPLTLKQEDSNAAPLIRGGGGLDGLKKEQEKIETQNQEINKSRNQEIKDDVADDTQAVSKKTAREVQIGVFSDEIANSYKKNISKTQQLDAGGKKDLAQWEKDLAIPGNLRTPEISAPEAVKRLTFGIGAAGTAKAELSKLKKDEDLAKNNLVFKDFRREEVLESLDEALAQHENRVQNLGKKKSSWFSMMFKKPEKSSKFKVQSSKSIKQENIKTLKQENTNVAPLIRGVEGVGSVKDNNKAKILNLEKLEKKEIFYQQPVVRRAVRDKPDFDNRPKMEDVKVVHPHLVGPIEELSEMTLVDFRRLGSTAQDSVDRIREKIEISAKEFFNRKIEAINAWRKSEPNRIYIELGRQSLLQKLPVEDLINQYNLENKPTLTKEEFDLISQLNKELRY